MSTSLLDLEPLEQLPLPSSPYDTPSGSQINLGPGINGVFVGDPSTLGSIDLTDPSGIPVPLAPARPSQSAAPTTGTGVLGGLQDIGAGLGSMLSGLPGAPSSLPGATSATTTQAITQAGGGSFLSGLSSLVFSSRLIVLIIGVLVIAAGIFSFRESQSIIGVVGKTARKAGEIAAT